MLQYQKGTVLHFPAAMTTVSEIRAEVVFGTPSQNCMGSGVCMIMNRPPRLLPLRCPHAPAWISCDTGFLRFRFAKAEVMRADVEQQLRKPFFLVEESFELPKRLADRLRLTTRRVAAGLYVIEENASNWVVFFRL